MEAGLVKYRFRLLAFYDIAPQDDFLMVFGVGNHVSTHWAYALDDNFVLEGQPPNNVTDTVFIQVFERNS